MKLGTKTIKGLGGGQITIRASEWKKYGKHRVYFSEVGRSGQACWDMINQEWVSVRHEFGRDFCERCIRPAFFPENETEGQGVPLAIAEKIAQINRYLLAQHNHEMTVERVQGSTEQYRIYVGGTLARGASDCADTLTFLDEYWNRSYAL